MKKLAALLAAAALLVLFARWLGVQRQKLEASRARAAAAARAAQAGLDSLQGGVTPAPAIEYDPKPSAGGPVPPAAGRSLSPAERESLRARELEYHLTSVACPEARGNLARLEAAARNPDSVATAGGQRLPPEELDAALARARAFIAKNCPATRPARPS